MTAPIQDLRDAIALLQQHDNQYLETNHPVDPNAELAGVYRHIGAGGTVKRPTRIGPAMMFNNIKGYPHSRILVGMHASRQRAALLLGCEASQLALEVGKAVKTPVAPVVVPADSAPCQEQIFLADDPDFDLRTLLPAPTNTPIDAGPFFCLGLALYQQHPLAGVGALNLASLRADNWISLNDPQGTGLEQVFIDACRVAGFTPQVAQRVNDVTSMISLVSAGVGVALVPVSARALRLDNVVYIDLQDRLAESELSMVYHRHIRSAVVRKVISLLNATEHSPG